MLTIDKQIETIRQLSQTKSVATKTELIALGVTDFEKLIQSDELIESTSKSFVLSGARFSNFLNNAEVSLIVPGGVICLSSALSYYGVTTVMPNKVYLALPEGCPIPDTESLAVEVVFMPLKNYSIGIVESVIDGIETKIYNLPKTVIDCLLYYWEVEEDIAQQAVGEVIQKKLCTEEELLDCASKAQLNSSLRRVLENILQNSQNAYIYT